MPAARICGDLPALQPRVALPLLAACAAPAPPPSGQPAMSQCLHLLQFTSLPAQPLADGIASVPWVHRYAEASRAAQPESATRPVSVGDAEGLGVATTASLQTAWGSRTLVVERDAGRLALAAGSALQPMINRGVAKVVTGLVLWPLDPQRAVAPPDFGRVDAPLPLEYGRFPASHGCHGGRAEYPHRAWLRSRRCRRCANAGLPSTRRRASLSPA